MRFGWEAAGAAELAFESEPPEGPSTGGGRSTVCMADGETGPGAPSVDWGVCGAGEREGEAVEMAIAFK